MSSSILPGSIGYPKPHVLFQQGDSPSSVYLVRSGEVFLTMPVSLAQAMCLRAIENSLVGLPATFSNEPYAMTAIAQEHCEVERMDLEQFWLLLVTKPNLALAVLKILAAETRSARIAIVDSKRKERADAYGGPRRKRVALLGCSAQLAQHQTHQSMATLTDKLDRKHLIRLNHITRGARDQKWSDIGS